MLVGACITLCAVSLWAWFRDRAARAHLAFSGAALSVAVYAFLELTLLHAQTIDAYAVSARWAQVPITTLLVSLAAFVHFSLGTGRGWLAVCAVGIRVAALPANFLTGQSLNYLEITALRSARILGEPVSTVVAVPNPWMLLVQASGLLLTLFVADASVTAWRRGQRGASVRMGVAIALFLLAGHVQAILVFWGYVQSPITISVLFVVVIGVMLYSIADSVARSSALTRALRASEQQAALAVDAAHMGIWSRDMSSESIWANPTWRAMFGFAADEPLTSRSLLERIHPDDRSALQVALARAIEHAGEYQLEVRVVLPDGQVRWIAALGRVESGPGGAAVGTRGATIDITQRKHAEHEVLRLRQDIAHVGRVSVMGQLAAALAHEINQPLGAILRNAEAAALFMDDPAPDLAEVRLILDDIRQDDQRASAVIGRLRRLLQRQPIEKCAIDVGRLLDDVAVLLRSDAAARQVHVEFDVVGHLPPILGDRVQLQQVLLNLVLNGMDAVDGLADGFRSVRVTAREEPGQAVEISVADTGPGIAPDALEKVFESFYTTKAAGLGMGLSISRSLVEAHGGRLWAEPDCATGARFRFTIPIAAGGG